MAPPSPFVIFLLLIVKSGMDAVSFAAKYVIRPSCLCCADTLLLLLILWLDDGSGSMSVFLVFSGMGAFLVEVLICFDFDTWMLLGGSFLFFLLEVLFLVTLLQLIHPLEPFWAIF